MRSALQRVFLMMRVAAGFAERDVMPVVTLLAGLLLVGSALGAPPAVAATQEEATVSEEMPATANDLVSMRAQNSPMLAADPTDSSFVALAHRVDAPDFSCALQLSDDGGATWFPAQPVSDLPDGVDKCYAPEIGFDSDGTLYFLFAGLSEPGNQPTGVFLTKSDDRGRTFTEPKEVLGAHSYQVRMRVDRQADGGDRLHLVWLKAIGKPTLGGLPAPPNPIMAAHSDDGGQTFSEPVQVSDPSRDRVVAPAVTVGAEGTVHVVYYDLKDDERDYRGLEGPVWDGTWTLVATSSRDRGDSYGAGEVVDDGVVPPDRVLLIFTMPPPAVASDGDGRVYAAWHDGRNGAWDVFLSRSVDAGASWSAPVRLNDDDAGASHQYLPALTAGPNGLVQAIFYDRRWDSENRDNHVSYTWSDDAGDAFSDNQRLTSEPTDSGIGQRYAVASAQGRADLGARLGLFVAGDQTVAAWADTRNAPTSPYQDIFTTQITNASVQQGGSLPWRDAVVALGAIAAIGSVVLGVKRFRSSKVRPDRGE